MFNFVREKNIKTIKFRIRKNPIFGSIEPNPIIKKIQKLGYGNVERSHVLFDSVRCGSGRVSKVLKFHCMVAFSILYKKA